MKLVYPKLPAVRCTPFFRIGGNGLANCLFVYGKAIVLANKCNARIIAPTWFNLSIGTYIRGQADKRHYKDIINNVGEVNGLKRLLVLLFSKKFTDVEEFERHDGVLVVEGIYDFFKPLLDYQEIVKDYLLNHINPALLKAIDDYNFDGCVAVHIRLGDFPISRRIPMEWYVNKIRNISNYKKILVFSDGTDSELKDILVFNGVERVFFGSAIQDIVAISRCQYLIGSDSSFSAWGAFLGQVPCVFYRLQFGQVLIQSNLQIIENY